MSEYDSDKTSVDDSPGSDKQSVNEENPEWDGSEAELVSDDDAEEYEIPETGIKLSFVMTVEEMYSCLYHSDVIKKKGKRAVIQSIILGIASVIFFYVYFSSDSQFKEYDLFFGIFSLIMIAVIWIVPHLYLKSLTKKLADGNNIEAEIYPTHIDIGRDDGEWKIELDGTSSIIEFDNIFMIFTEKDRAFAIPERVIEPELYNEVRAILLSGTNPAED